MKPFFPFARFFLLLVFSQTAFCQTYKVTGSLDFKTYMMGDVFEKCVYDFDLSADDCKWVLKAKVKDHYIRGVLQTNNFDYIEAAFDGEQIYTVHSMETLAGQGSNVSNVAVGTIGIGLVPVDADTFIKDIWLGFASHCYFATLTNDWIYPLYIDRSTSQLINGDFQERSRRQLFVGASALPSAVVFIYEFNGKPRDDGLDSETLKTRTNAVFTVDQFTNINSFAVPTHLTTKRFSPAGILSQAVEISAVISPFQKTEVQSFVPILPGKTSISDLRFPNISGGVYTTFISTKWPETKQTEPIYRQQVRADAQSKQDNAMTLSRNDARTTIVRVLVLAFLLASLIIPLAMFWKTRNKKTNNENKN
jgi:hypothetical protein